METSILTLWTSDPHAGLFNANTAATLQLFPGSVNANTAAVVPAYARPRTLAPWFGQCEHCCNIAVVREHCCNTAVVHKKVEHCKEQSQEVIQDGYRRVWQLAVVIIGPLLEAIFRAIHLGLLLGTRPQVVLWELGPLRQNDELCEERLGTVSPQAVFRELDPVFQHRKVDCSCTSSAHDEGCDGYQAWGWASRGALMNWVLEMNQMAAHAPPLLGPEWRT